MVERTIASISPGGAGNNVIGITVALAAALGNDGDSICLLPNRRIERTSAGPCVQVDFSRGVLLEGFFLKSHTGTDCHGIEVINGGGILLEGIAAQVEDYGFHIDGKYSCLAINGLSSSDRALSAWGCTRGFNCASAGMWCYYSAAVSCGLYGYLVSSIGFMNAYKSLAIDAGTTGYYCQNKAMLNAPYCTARWCGTGYYALGNSYLPATTTNVNNNANGVDYNPAGVLPGYFIGNGDAVIYAS